LTETKTAVPKTIGDRIREVRIALGKTQDEFGDMLGVTSNSVARWERGGRTPSRTVLLLIENTVKSTGIFDLTG